VKFNSTYLFLPVLYFIVPNNIKTALAINSPKSGDAVIGASPVCGGAVVTVGVGVAVAAALHNALVMVLVSSVTAPFLASSCPCMVAPVCAVMDVNAKICPIKVEYVPNVAELVTCQKTRQYRAPFRS